MSKKKIAVILCNLGGPDSPEAVKPFLFNLFNDPAIISLPNPFRFFLAKLISSRREKTAQEIYEFIGGKSPLLELTEAQAKALEEKLSDEAEEYKTFIAMRYWHPFTKDAAEKVKQYQPDEVVILPLYPQFSTTTSESSVKEWKKYFDHTEVKTVCCYHDDDDFIASHAALLQKALAKAKGKVRILFSAHGLPKKVIEKGDPYQWQVEQTADLVMEKIGKDGKDFVVCYQSKVGPLEWISPSTEDEIIRAGKDGVGVIIVPIAFVSEHSETLVELDIEYKHLADEHKVPEYIRVPALGEEENFINSLAKLCKNAVTCSGTVCRPEGKSGCPNHLANCPANAA